MGEVVELSVALSNDKVQFRGTARSNPPVTLDYKPPLGDGQGYTGLELLLMSLAGCSGTAVLVLLRKAGKHVSGLSVNAKGVRRDTHPMSFQSILLEFVVKSPGAQETDVRSAIRAAEQSFCPVWAMLKNNVEVRSECRLLAS
jgi:putative redox protein